MMANHIDTVLFNGRRGSSDEYNRLHDLLVPDIADGIMEIARTSKAGSFLTTTLPEVAELVSVPKRSRTDAIPLDEIEGADPMPLIATLRLPAARTVTI
jgi:hypothetical protein